MRRLGYAAAMIAALPLLASCVAAVIGSAPESGTATDTRARGAADEDAALAGRVRSRIAADPSLRSAAVQVSALGGSVSLNGLVASSAARSRAEQLARTVQGVTAVNNLLKVK